MHSNSWRGATRLRGLLMAAMAAVWLCAGNARGADSKPPEPAPPPGPGHAWLVVPDAAGRGTTAIMHAPPRVGGAGRGAGTGEGVEAGIVHLAAWLSRSPTHVASWGDRVWVALQREGMGKSGTHQRRVLTAREVRRGAGWKMSPSDRLEVLPSLPGDVELAGFVGTPAGPAAMLARETSLDGWDLVILDGEKWRPAPLPWPEAAAPGASWLVSMPEGIGMVGVGARGGRGPAEERADLWVGRIGKSPGANAEEAEWPLEWERRSIAWRPSWQPTARPRRGDDAGPELIGVDGYIVASEWAKGSVLTLSLVRASGVYPLARLAEVPSQRSLAASPGSGSVIVLWDPDTGAGGRAAGRVSSAEQPARLRIAEVSITGQTIYAGPARSGGPLTGRDLQWIVAMLVGVMAAIVVFVLRSDQASTPRLPEGAESAGPMRRLLATAFDLAPALLVASALTGVRPTEVLAPAEWMTNDAAARPLLTAVLLAWGHTTLGDWLFAGSLGKSMVGCQVISLRSVAAAVAETSGKKDGEANLRPTLAQAAIRNGVRWFMPFLGVLMLFDALRRHPGDLLAGTAVVLPEEEGPEVEE